MEKGLSFSYQVFACVVVLFSGAYAGVSNKFLYDMKVDGDCGSNKFQKPYFFTLFMFVGEALCLMYYYAEQLYFHYYPKPNDADFPTAALLGDGSNEALSSVAVANGTVQYGAQDVQPLRMVKSKPPVWFFAVLSLFDLSATTIGGVGLQWVTASANQMLRGSMILFTALWTLLIFRKNLSMRKWGAIGVTMGGLILVGGAGMLDPASNDSTSATSNQVLIGIVLVLAGSALNACQGVLEEKLMKGLGDGVEAHPLEVVGWEGVFGCIWSAFVMLPIVQAMSGGDCGSVENSKDTLQMLHNSPTVVVLVIFYAISLAFMNNYSQVVSKYLSAVHRMLLNTSRVVLVWVIDLIIYYCFSKSNGEAWDVYSWMQLGGFALLIAGSALYVRAAQVEAAAAAAVKGLAQQSETEQARNPRVPVNGGQPELA